MARTYGNFTDFIDFSRASSGTYLGSDGLLKTAADNVPRIEYDANGNEIGLLIEEQRTNLLPYSDPTLGGWNPSGATIENQTTLSLGIFYGTKVISGGFDWHRINDTNLSVTSGTDYSCTLFYKVGTSGNVLLNLRDGTNSTETRIGGTIGSCSVLRENAGIAALLSEELIGDGVYRMQVKFTPNATISTFSFGGGPYSTTSGEDVIILGGQLEAGSFATSYIPTSGATATRSADIADIATANFGYNPKAGTIVVEFEQFQEPSDAGSRGVTGTDLLGRFAYVNAGKVKMYDGTTVITASPTISANTFVKSASTFNDNGQAISVDGASTVSGAFDGTWGSGGVLYIGYIDNIYMSGHIKSIKYLPRRNSNTQLQEFTS